MDLCSSELFSRLPSQVDATIIQPRDEFEIDFSFANAKQEMPIHILDRLINRQWDYPRFAKRELSKKYDAFHVVDHSYASIVHKLPSNRTGVYCHDLDAFRCLLEAERERRPFWFRAMSRRILNGMQKAALVFHNSRATGKQYKPIVWYRVSVWFMRRWYSRRRVPSSSRYFEDARILNSNAN